MNFNYSDKVLAGTGVFVLNENAQILLGKRKGSHGAGEWSLPGGHCDKGETSDQGAIREVKEETGLIVKEVRKLTWNDHYFPEVDRQYITLYYVAYDWTGEPYVVEPHKCEKWEWFDLDNLPKPLFHGLDTIVKSQENYLTACSLLKEYERIGNE